MSCSRSWQVEAARDGRLGEREQKAHARHVLACADCRREQHALDELRAGLRTVAGSDISDAELRNGRQALLARALAERNERVVDRRGARDLVAFALVAAALALVVWVGFHRAPSSFIVVRATGGSSYRRYDDRGRHIIKVDAGRLEIEVQHAQGEPRLRVLTPDGVLDDVGTTFVVEVSAARTQLVEVSSGLVRVAIGGRPVAMVQPGHPYRPYAPTAVAASEPDAPSAPSAGLPRDAEPEAVAQQGASSMPPFFTAKPTAAAGHSPLRKSAHTTQPLKSHTKDPESDAGQDHSPSGRAFSEAVQTLDRGQAVEAARRLRAFAQTYPTDRRAEDAAYLRVVAWLRAGKRAEARSAAEEFLRRYPHGFRRHELEGLLQH